MLSTDNFCKQFGPRSGLAESGSKLFDTLIVFLKELFEKVYFFVQKKTQQTSQKHEILPSMQRFNLSLQLLNGYYSTSPPLGNTTTNGRYCGSTAPVVMETSSYFLRVTFVSDASASGPGFSLSFNEVHVTCGGQLSLSDTMTSGTFTSPNYPQGYPHNVDCVWIITAPASERIKLDFIEQFAIESHTE